MSKKLPKLKKCFLDRKQLIKKYFLISKCQKIVEI